MTNPSSQTHDHQAELGNRPQYEDINTPAIFLVGVISSIITFLIIGLVQGLAYRWENAFVRERSYDSVNIPLRENH